MRGDTAAIVWTTTLLREYNMPHAGEIRVINDPCSTQHYLGGCDMPNIQLLTNETC